jgi:hypothetical protein
MYATMESTSDVANFLTFHRVQDAPWWWRVVDADGNTYFFSDLNNEWCTTLPSDYKNPSRRHPLEVDLYVESDLTMYDDAPR